MKSATLLFCPILFLVITFTPAPVKTQPVNTGDSLALVDLYNSTNGPSWSRNDNWFTGPVHTWFGVQVTGSRVTSLSLPRNKLSGSLPVSIGNLTELTDLSFFWNDSLAGDIPSSIGSLVNLTYLNLASNKLSGSIPASIGNLAKLEYLDLYENNLTGAIPSSIGDLTNLLELWLNENNLTEIPSSIGDLKNLNSLLLDNNQISGSIPTSIQNLKKLWELTLNQNQLTGNIPDSIGELSSLEFIDVSHNQLSGAIPPSIGQLSNASYIDLSHNQLSETIPPFTNNVRLVNLYLSNNRLTGSIPGIIGPTTLYMLDLSNNQLNGNLPSSIGNITGLRYLLLQNNQFTGVLPASIRKLGRLFSADLSNNFFTDAGYIDAPIYNVLTTNGSLLDNHFTFNSLEFVAQKLRQLAYYSQRNLNIHRNGNTLSVSAGGKLSNNTYKWYKVGSATPTIIAGDSTFEPAENGDYYAEVTNAVATLLTLKTDTVTFVAAATAGKKDQKLNIYPNPAKNILTVNGFDKALTSTITITDVSGNVKLRTTTTQHATVQINVSSLKPGNYILFSIANSKTVSVNFVKQ